jgi:hypothetical protein
MFATGATALWQANAIERAARPPFVLSEVVLTGVALRWYRIEPVDSKSLCCEITGAQTFGEGQRFECQSGIAGLFTAGITNEKRRR